MSSLKELFPSEIYGARPVLILDGGMGTTLQAPPFELALDSALWSSELLATNKGKQTLHQLHSTWIENGADLIGTCTYQSHVPLFLPTSQSEYSAQDVERAREIMLSALSIASDPSLPRTSRSAATPLRPGAILCLGPFGAIVQPGQEYAGLYPPPFGSRDTPSSLSYSAEAARAVDSVSLEEIGNSGDLAQDNLTKFHLSRLQKFAESNSFESMKIIGFETIPILKEISAIRRAVAFFKEGRNFAPKPFYISFVFPLIDNEPKYPDPELAECNLQEQVNRLVEATFQPSSLPGIPFATPAAIGINCTNPKAIEKILSALKSPISELNLAEKPWLVLYPDGGSVYDVFTKTWSNPTGMDSNEWANLLAKNVETALESDLYAGVIVGGCCKSTPESIRALREICVDRRLIN